MMKINPNKINQIYQTKPNTTHTVKETNTTSNVDKIEVRNHSKQSITLKDIKSDLTQSISSTLSHDKINELKEQIKNGQYEVKHKQVAEAIIAFSETMLGDMHD